MANIIHIFVDIWGKITSCRSWEFIEWSWKVMMLWNFKCHCLNHLLFFFFFFISSPGVSLGQSSEFRTIWALEIAGHLGMPQPTEPKIRFVAGVHGNAAVGPELLLEFASVLCLNYGRNPAVTKASFTKHWKTLSACKNIEIDFTPNLYYFQQQCCVCSENVCGWKENF